MVDSRNWIERCATRAASRKQRKWKVETNMREQEEQNECGFGDHERAKKCS
jgi:hypothetical protein